MENNTTASAIAEKTPWLAEPDGTGFYRVVNSASEILAQQCVKEEAVLFASAPELLRLARSAASAFEERISCLEDELAEEFADTKDIEDQIGNYRWLLDRHEEVIAAVEAGAA